MPDAIAEVTVKHWGNSLAMRIPGSVANALRLKENSRIRLKIEGGRVVMEPSVPAVDIDALIDRITPRNRHAEMDFGESVGREAW